MKRRDFLKSAAIFPVMGIVPEIVRPKVGSSVKPLFHLCRPLENGQFPEPVESMGCKTALRDLRDTIGCFQTPHIVEVTCPECLCQMTRTDL